MSIIYVGCLFTTRPSEIKDASFAALFLKSPVLISPVLCRLLRGVTMSVNQGVQVCAHAPWVRWFQITAFLQRDVWLLGLFLFSVPAVETAFTWAVSVLALNNNFASFNFLFQNLWQVGETKKKNIFILHKEKMIISE